MNNGFTENIRNAFGSLVSNKLRAGLTTLGIGIGIASVVVLISLGQSVQLYVSNQFLSAGSNLAFILTAQGKKEDARRAYHEALRLEPNLRIAQLALQKLEPQAPAPAPLPLPSAPARNSMVPEMTPIIVDPAALMQRAPIGASTDSALPNREGSQFICVNNLPVMVKKPPV